MAAAKNYTLNEVTENLHVVIQRLNDVKGSVDALDAWQAPWSNAQLEAKMAGAEAGDGLIVKTAIAALKAIVADFALSNAALDDFAGFRS